MVWRGEGDIADLLTWFVGGDVGNGWNGNHE